MEVVIRTLEGLRRWGQKLGPYLLLELVLPGGTLVALLLFLYQSKKLSFGTVVPRAAIAVTRALVVNVRQGV
jgi:hypothetical protein